MTHAAIRYRYHALASALCDTLPASPERALCLERLRESMFHANAGVATQTLPAQAEQGPESLSPVEQATQPTTGYESRTEHAGYHNYIEGRPVHTVPYGDDGAVRYVWSDTDEPTPWVIPPVLPDDCAG